MGGNIFDRFKSIEDLNNIPKGDMPGDKIHINFVHLEKAKTIIPVLMDMLTAVLENHLFSRGVISVCGGSGTGKSEIASLLSYYLNETGTGSYILSGDNYPHRIPEYNDAERLRIFRQSGTKGLIVNGQYTEDIRKILNMLQGNNEDTDPKFIETYPWLEIYHKEGKLGLRSYLGTPNEIDFNGLNEIISMFKNGADRIFLKRMGRKPEEIWYGAVNFRDIKVLIIEWTHGNSHYLRGVDIPVLLGSTPKETLEFRKQRNRDRGTDSPFTEIVLGIEQELLIAQAVKAKIIVSSDGRIISHKEYMRAMTE